MTVRALDREIKENGLDQQQLVRLLRNIVDTVNELVDDHATNKTFTDELKTDLNALRADVVTIATKLDNDATVTDSNYAAQIAGTTVASSGAASLSDSTDLTLNRG